MNKLVYVYGSQAIYKIIVTYESEIKCIEN